MRSSSCVEGQLLLTGGPHDYEYLKNSRQDVDGMDDKQEWRLLQVSFSGCSLVAGQWLMSRSTSLSEP
jgi:myosin heavy subunit